jgi:hypothetical protein
MEASQAILDTNEDGSIPVNARRKWDGSIPVDTRHKLGWQHPSRYSTQMVKPPSRSILDTNGDGAIPVDTPLDRNGNGIITVDTQHKWGWHHPSRYSTQMRMAAPRSILDTNGEISIPVDTRHK